VGDAQLLEQPRQPRVQGAEARADCGNDP
jgi:hypothetical protein